MARDDWGRQLSNRHLPQADLERALRAGRAIENWIGRGQSSLGPVIRWLRISPTKADAFSVGVFEAVDVGSAEFLDVYSFPSLNPDLPFGASHTFETMAEALEFARASGANPEKFVNSGIIQDEYRDSRAA